MSSRCIVPNCKNTVGIQFANDSKLKHKLRGSFKIKDVSNRLCFVCLDHFESCQTAANDPEEHISVQSASTLIPSEVSKDDNNRNDCQGKLSERVQNSETAAEMSGTEIGNVASIKVESNQHIQDLNNVSELSEEMMFDVDLKMCRLCMKEESHLKDIFEDIIDDNVPIFVAIIACIYPMAVSKEDKLPTGICTKCLESLISYFKFRSICLRNDKKLRKSYDQKCSQNRKLKTSSYRNQRKRANYERITDSESDIDDEMESFNKFINDRESLDSTEMRDRLNSPPPLVPIRKKNVHQFRTETGQTFGNVEEELLKVLKGALTEEQAQAENLIIHVENDDEPCNEKVTMLSELKLPLVIKPVSSAKSPSKKRSLCSRRIIEGDGKLRKTIKTETNLPSTSSDSDHFKSKVGIYEGVPVKYVFDTEFCNVDGYIFEYRLCKGELRYLRCVLQSCPAMALQEKISAALYSNAVTVRKAHNHRKPLEAERKKQMFFYVMKRKMQSDKSLNFRNVYEEVCRQDEDMKDLVPLRNVISEICRHQLSFKIPVIQSFDQFYELIEEDAFQKLQFTHNGKQFYQEKFTAEDDAKAVVFANRDIIDQVSDSQLMYVDASFKIDTNEEFKYHLVTVLVWVEDSYYPVLFALVNSKSQEIYKKIFEYLHDTLTPKLRPEEIVTDYEANLYYALGETYLDSSIGGSVFYYTQNLYKKICSLNLSRDLETNSYFRNVYHMLLMLPLLPVNTILDGLNNMEIQARDLGLGTLTRPVFDHVRNEWIMRVTPDLFCVHRLENRINENVVAPFKKLRDYIMLSKGKMQKQTTTIVTVVEKLIELEYFLQITYSAPSKRSFARDLSSSQKKNVLRAWQYIESHPKININNFFSKVIGYIKCMENQLWIWGFYRYIGDVNDELINAANFSIVSNEGEVVAHKEDMEVSDAEQNDAATEIEPELVDEDEEEEEKHEMNDNEENGQIVMEAVIDENGGFVLQNNKDNKQSANFGNSFVNYVYKE